MSRIQLQTVDLTKKPVAPVAQKSASSGTGLFKIPELVLKENSSTYVRLVPQPAGSQNNWTETVPFFYIPGYRTIAISPTQSAILKKAYWALKQEGDNNPEVKLYSKENTKGLNLNPKYRQVFLGFEVGLDAKQKGSIVGIALPANRPGSVAGQLQAGTSLFDAAYSTNFGGQPKYPNLLNPKAGNIVKLSTTGQGLTKTYKADVDAEAPVELVNTENLKPFSEVLNYLSDDEFKKALKVLAGPLAPVIEKVL